MTPEIQIVVNKKEYKIWVEEGVVVGQYGENVIVTKKIVDDSIKDRKKHFGNFNIPLLIDSSRMKYITRSALVFSNQPEGKIGITALGMLINNPIFKILAVFFCTYILRSDHPTMVFTDKKEAIEWLKKFREEEDISMEPDNEHN